MFLKRSKNEAKKRLTTILFYENYKKMNYKTLVKKLTHIEILQNPTLLYEA